MWRHRVTCLPPKNASAPWDGPGSRWLTIIVRQVSYIHYLLACQKSQRSTPHNIVKSALSEVGFSAVAILGGGWLQSPASDGPPWHCLSVHDIIWAFKVNHVATGAFKCPTAMARRYPHNISCDLLSGYKCEPHRLWVGYDSSCAILNVVPHSRGVGGWGGGWGTPTHTCVCVCRSIGSILRGQCP